MRVVQAILQIIAKEIIIEHNYQTFINIVGMPILKDQTS